MIGMIGMSVVCQLCSDMLIIRNSWYSAMYITMSNTVIGMFSPPIMHMYLLYAFIYNE